MEHPSPRPSASLTVWKKFPDFRHSCTFLARHHSSLSTNIHNLSGIIFLVTLWTNFALYNSVTTRLLRFAGPSASPRFSFLKDLCISFIDSIFQPSSDLKSLPLCLWNSMYRQEIPFFLMCLLSLCSNQLCPKGHGSVCSPLWGWLVSLPRPWHHHALWTCVLPPSYCCSQTIAPSSSIKMTSFETLNIGLYYRPLFSWQPFTDSSVTSPSFWLTVTFCNTIPIVFLMI